MTPPSELSATWSRITGALQTIMSPEVYGLWFPKFSLLEDSGKTLTLVCDDPMAALWVENSYTPELKQAAMLALGTERQVKFICADEVASLPAAEGQPQKASSRSKTPQVQDSPAAPAKKQRSQGTRACLNDLYTFDSFVVYEDSRFAYQAGLSIAQSERALFNPLFLYGKSGVGKTHLLQAIGHEVLHQDSSANVVYVTGEQFANELLTRPAPRTGRASPSCAASTARRTSCWWTTCSLFPARRRRWKSSCIRLTSYSTPTKRS